MASTPRLQSRQIHQRRRNTGAPEQPHVGFNERDLVEQHPRIFSAAGDDGARFDGPDVDHPAGRKLDLADAAVLRDDERREHERQGVEHRRGCLEKRRKVADRPAAHRFVGGEGDQKRTFAPTPTGPEHDPFLIESDARRPRLARMQPAVVRQGDEPLWTAQEPRDSVGVKAGIEPSDDQPRRS